MMERVEGEGPVPYCLWCEDGLPCAAATQAAAQPVRQLPRAAEKAIQKPKPKRIKKPERSLTVAVIGPLSRESVHRVDGLEKEMHHGKTETLGDLAPKAIQMAKAGKSSGEIAEALGIPPWRVYQSDAVRAARKEAGVPKTSKPRKDKAASEGNRKRPKVEVAIALPGLVPVMLSEAALNRVWTASSLEEKAAMISHYMAQVEPA
jgi:hypothetical protein